MKEEMFSLSLWKYRRWLQGDPLNIKPSLEPTGGCSRSLIKLTPELNSDIPVMRATAEGYFLHLILHSYDIQDIEAIFI